MRLRLKVNWRGYSHGQVIEPPDGQAAEMLRRGIAEPAEDERIETATYPKRGKKQ